MADRHGEEPASVLSARAEVSLGERLGDEVEGRALRASGGEPLVDSLTKGVTSCSPRERR
ncbi:hypothetical protein STAN_7083 [Streptomyces sp. CBMAI 2042]|nr:hypothetical protein STAN_7083 [Streptomyces sp. CBMAI 2042]